MSLGIVFARKTEYKMFSFSFPITINLKIWYNNDVKTI